VTITGQLVGLSMPEWLVFNLLALGPNYAVVGQPAKRQHYPANWYRAQLIYKVVATGVDFTGNGLVFGWQALNRIGDTATRQHKIVARV